MIRFLLLLALSLPLLLSAGEKKICLTMIVKNESKIIERCFESVQDIADYIVVCDTGSTDNTGEIVEQYLQEHEIPGKVFHHQWKNFGHNRTLSAIAAQEYLREHQIPAEDVYLLFLDADMVLEKKEDFDKQALNADSYNLVQKDCWTSWHNLRLAKASFAWESIGFTHEYWGAPGVSWGTNLETLWIEDRGDGGCKKDKFQRDIALLTAGLEAEPSNERYLFYLARSYHCIDEYEKAIAYYQRRIDRGGWKEEIWYSKYMIGECYEAIDDWDKALKWYLEAYSYDPQRAESIKNITTHYRKKGDNTLAYIFAKHGKAIPFPKNHTLFVAHPVYDYGFDEELSIAAFYTPFRHEGHEITDALLLRRDIPSYIRDEAYRNIIYYSQNLKNASYRPIVFERPSVSKGSACRYNAMNPSIVKTEEGYEVICRTVNYIQIGAKWFKSLDIQDTQNKIYTRNFLLLYDKDFNLLSQHEIIENLDRPLNGQTQVLGLEDCRLFIHQGERWFTCTTSDTHPDGMRQISLCKLSVPTDGCVTVEQLIPLLGPNVHRCEKNWLPFITKDHIHMMYMCDPLTILKPRLTTGNCEILCKKEQPHNFDRFSGSASPIPFNDGYLMLVHEVAYTDERIYLHRFVTLNKDFEITHLSKPFTFQHRGVEFCCGMTLDHAEQNLLIGVGFEDREAYLCSVPKSEVEGMLKPI